MEEKEIIEGLMLMLADEDINVMKLSKRIGFKNYKKFDKALRAAFDLVETNSSNQAKAIKEIKHNMKHVKTFEDFINEGKAYKKASNNELAMYIINLSNEILNAHPDNDPKHVAYVKKDLEEVKKELESRKL